jgi:hypothetical protein
MSKVGGDVEGMRESDKPTNWIVRCGDPVTVRT